MSTIIQIISVIVGLILHFLPTIIAFRKNAYNKLSILALNLIPDAVGIILAIVLYTMLGNASMTGISYVPAVSSGSAMVFIVSIISIIIWITALVKAIRSY